ncbi:SDR family NAD(P)-dependent oxidoreductase [Jiulongibacter sp. NS-SX5]|uniref:SDR family NAD(P)-dependent oxidoreductase n=1 Tax=Jiulongibacter sp. NS-SX5 TaxID=3463854 RepID=UPI004059414E
MAGEITFNFKGQTAIVTGAAIGIGFTIAQMLIESGANVILNDFDQEAGEKAAKKLGKNCIFIQGDAGKTSVLAELISKGLTKFGSIEYAIANAGITTFGPFLSYPEENFNQLIDLNIKGTFFLCQKMANYWIKNAISGKMVLMSSTTGLQPHDELEAYGMTKAAIRFMAKSLGTQLAPHKIHINSVTPGATETERTTSVEGYAEGWSKIVPTRRPATTEDIAKATLFLLSQGADQITGENINVDGGWSNVGPVPEAI